jgi:ribosomal subunit interface protein
MALNKNLKTKNIEIDEETKDYLAKRIKKFDTFIADDTSPAIADIELERMTGQQSGRIFRAEVNLKIGDRYLRAEEEAENIREAIDKMKDEMVRELRDAKEKERTQTRDGARKAKEQLREERDEEDYS